jgi:hypothetical protein
MMITEGDLSRFRSGKADRLMIRDLPYQWFTLANHVFESEWPQTDPNARWTEPDHEIVVVFAFTESVPVLKPQPEWFALDHQCGGFLCEHLHMIATRLKPRPAIYPLARQIAQEGWGADRGLFDGLHLLASRIGWYLTALKRMGVDCECTWRHLTEGVYPIDATDANLRRLVEDPPKLSDLALNYSPARYDPNPAILILADNSD